MIGEGGCVQSLPGILVRRFAAQDAAAVAGIMEASPEAAKWSAESILQLAKAGVQVWVATERGVLAGFIAARCTGQEYEILNLAVLPAHRRRGAAHRLLRAALDRAHACGCAQVYLEVRPSNAAALTLYTSHGFRECGRRPRYYRQPDEDAIVFSLALDRSG